jgi:hypothetical protein
VKDLPPTGLFLFNCTQFIILLMHASFWQLVRIFGLPKKDLYASPYLLCFDVALVTVIRPTACNVYSNLDSLCLRSSFSTNYSVL